MHSTALVFVICCLLTYDVVGLSGGTIKRKPSPGLATGRSRSKSDVDHRPESSANENTGRTLVIRNMQSLDDESARARLSELGFVVDGSEEEVSWYVSGGSEEAVRRLRDEGARISSRPLPAREGHAGAHEQEQDRSQVRKDRIFYRQAKQSRLRERRVLSEEGGAKREAHKQWRRPASEQEHSERADTAKRARFADNRPPHPMVSNRGSEVHSRRRNGAGPTPRGHETKNTSKNEHSFPKSRWHSSSRHQEQSTDEEQQ